MIRIALLALVLVAASPRERAAEGWLRKGDQAALRGAWAEAARWYEKAELWAEDPGLVAFNLATARYHLAESDPRELAAAEAGFRACLTGPRRGRALLGLGCCLLLRASASLDGVTLRAAVDRFSEALAEPDVDPSAVRYNLERARLLLAQSRTRPDQRPEPGEDNPPEEPGPEDKGPSEQKKPADGKTDVEGKKEAGKGLITPVPLDKDAPRIGEEDAQLHLDDAVRRILAEWQAHRRSKSRPAPKGKDW
jgi:hypothetical protein